MSADQETSTFDYIIVGAGSAGCVLAERLSADSNVRVLLVEAGSARSHPLVKVPMGVGKTLSNPDLCWYYATEPDAGNANRPQMWIRGRGLGGSSIVNGMIYCRGNPGDYDDWEAHGCPGWGWRNMAPVFKQMEDHILGDGGKRGVGGPLHVSLQSHHSPLTEAILDAGTALGVPRVDDVNEPDGECLGYTPVTIHKGRRWSAYDAFLKPAMARPNLTVVTESLVTKVLMDAGRAIGVEILRDGQRAESHGLEIILSAGALHTPKILQLSGIGPGDHLKSLGIPVLLDRPGVGAHLREHKTISMQVRLKQPFSHNVRLRGPRMFAELVRYWLTRTGAFASTYDLNGFIKTDPGLSRPDAQVTFWSLSMRRDAEVLALEREPGLLVMGYPCRSDSEGSVLIRSADPADPPVIRTNFLATDHDRRIIIGLFRFMRRIFAHAKVAPFIAAETWPAGHPQTDEEILEAARNDATCLHAAGTCRMGDSDDAVLDDRLRLKGVQGLRVVDLSVFPTQISGNPNGPVMAVAWRASELIREDRTRKASSEASDTADARIREEVA